MKKRDSLLNYRDLIAYFLVAGTGVIVQFISGKFFSDYYGVSYSTSVTLGYVVSFFVGFFLTKMFAFDARNTSKTRREMVKFGIVALISLGITVGVSTGVRSILLDFWGEKHYLLPISFVSEKVKEINLTEVIALLAATGLSFVNNFILHKRFTFRSTGFYDRAKERLGI